ncbi:cation:proton antiporter [Schaalia sp. JY-X159]|uniref:cation:proton antiporter n=1 Tax=Schaalia sp. JY-X159 TaxID=2758575 RepID=UPI00165DC94D|nr:cation:proton antiporter [Schaalia sp. JY-X159]
MALEILLIPLAALLAPILGALLRRWVSIPLIVFEILLGILIGPSVLGWVQGGNALDLMSNLGLALLFFMAGNEIDIASIRGRTGKRALAAWGISIAIALAAALIIGTTPAAIAIITIALVGTALGTITPILRDAGLNKGPIGTAISAAGAIGEFGPLVAITIFLGSNSPIVAFGYLAVFAGVAAFAFFGASHRERPRLVALISASLHTSGQFAVRVVIALLAALVTLALTLGVDFLLGAFCAGMLSKVLLRGIPANEQEFVEGKLEGLAYGFMIPIFFVTSGVMFPLSALLEDARALIMVPVFALVILVVRGVPGFFTLDRGATVRDRATVSLFTATSLPLIIAVTNIGVQEGALSTELAAALVGAGMLTVLLYPLLALAVSKTQKVDR